MTANLPELKPGDRVQRKQYAANLIDDLTAMWLEERADELERDAAFTGMVQLGQEIGDE